MSAVLLAALALLALAPAQAERSAAPGGPGEQPVNPPPGPIRHDYAISPDEVRAVFELLIEASGLARDPEAEGEGEVVTTYLRFSPDDFGRNVAVPPPRASPAFPYLQPQNMSTGEYRLRVRIEPQEGFTRIYLLAELRTTAYNSFTRDHDQLVRDSDGTIEKAMYARFEALLDERRRGARETPAPPE